MSDMLIPGGMSHTLAVFVPSEGKDGLVMSSDAHKALVRNALRFFSNQFGGATALSAQGAWVLPDSRLAVEDVTVVMSWAGEIDPNKVRLVLLYAKLLKNHTQQDAVSVLVDGKLIFV